MNHKFTNYKLFKLNSVPMFCEIVLFQIFRTKYMFQNIKRRLNIINM